MNAGIQLYIWTLLGLMIALVESDFELESLVQSSSCQIEWDPFPCSCYEAYDSPYLLCKNIGSTQVLMNIFSSLKKELEFNEFRLTQSNVLLLPKGVFGKASFQGFQFHDNNMTTVERGAFQGSESTATGIVFMNNKMTNLDFSAVCDLSRLQTLIISHEDITSIPDKAFAGAPFLAKIELTFNPIATIGKRAFADLGHLNSFVLKRNSVPITQIGEGAFSNPTAEHVESFVFRNNNISDTALSPNSLQGIQAALMDLQDSNLDRLDEAVFTPLLNSMASLRNSVIMGFGNPLKCDQTLKWLTTKTKEYKKPLIGFICPNGKSVVDLKESDLIKAES